MSEARLVDPRSVERLEVLGPAVEILVDGSPCVIRGSIPPGGAVPMHSHPEPETFIALSGDVEGLSFESGSPEWVRVRPGDVFHVPGGARHGWRNRSGEPAVSIVVTEPAIARFFREVAGPPSDDAHARFAAVAARYGHWLATPEENAAVGIEL